MNLNNLTGNFIPEPASSGAIKNVLAHDVEIKGTIKFKDELIIDGTIEGEIVSTDGILTVGKNAKVRGEIKTKSATVHGTIDGNIVVTDRIELKASSEVNGDIKANRITIEEGATFIGKSEVSPNSSNKAALKLLEKPLETRATTPPPANTPSSPNHASSDQNRKQQAAAIPS